MDRRKRILNEPSYWEEGVNSELYNALVQYMESHQLNKTQLAQYLDISKGRLSQLLNDGEINFSLEKLFELALKLGKYPKVELQDKQNYFEEKRRKRNYETEQTIHLSVLYNYDMRQVSHLGVSKRFWGVSRNEYNTKIVLN